MSAWSNPDYLKNEQYNDSSNLEARIRLHQLYSTDSQDIHILAFDQLLEDVPDTAKILEVGSGRGDLWRKNLNRIPSGWEVTLSDLSSGMLNDAKQSLGDAKQRFQWHEFDATSIPFENQAFDAVLAHFMLYHVPDLDSTIREIRRVLKADGVLHAITNGENHMGEMETFVDLLIPLPRQPRMREVLKFRLETGGEALAKQFGEIDVVRYKAGLRVTQIQPIMDYILSSATEVVTQANKDDFTAYAQEMLDRDGAIRITKDSGMLVAKGYAS